MMRTISFVMVVFLSGCSLSISSEVVQDALSKCENNGGLSHIEMSDQKHRDGDFPLWVHAHCNNDAEFDLGG